MSEAPVVETTAGKVRGQTLDRVDVFKGIPYAAPPLGELRFRPPAPVTPWSAVRDALDYGPSCPQPSSRPQGWSQEPALSEDCLYLNVWTPPGDRAARRPVLVWFHGGGFSIGSGSWPVYDGAALAHRGDAVVVTVNHRLGILGYLHLAEIGGADFASSGNVGMLDLVATLEWVRDNIASFGGDPSCVTIFGESGGGAKVSTLLAMPAARGLFHRAAIQSGPGLRAKPQEQAAEIASKIVADLGAGADVRALQALPAERLSEAQEKLGRAGSFAFSPVLDAAALPAHPGHALKHGTAADVPVIVGTNRDEASLFLAMNSATQNGAELDDAGLLKRLSLLGEAARPIVDAYRATRPGASNRDLLIAIESDRMMRIPSIELAERKIAGSTTPVFMYLFRWASGPLGSAHGYEIGFVFDNVRPPVMKQSPGRDALGARMSEAWLAFARTGDPSHAGIPAWPAYTADRRATMIFDRAESVVEDDPCAGHRAAWEHARVPTGMPA
jgi:para-nitrobenzyl esterase